MDSESKETNMTANQSSAAPSITIYSATWCAFCHAAKEYLDKKGFKYTDKDIESDPSFAEESVRKSGQTGIPVLDINGTIIVGFDRPKIDAALKV
jgi:glutaredoxin-like YruB-family protein